MRKLQFKSESAEIEAMGISLHAIEQIFLGNPVVADTLRLASATPPDVRDWVAREYSSARFAFRALRQHAIHAPDPWTDAMVCGSFGYTCRTRSALPYDIPPLFYPITSANGREFWLISYGVYGRITHVFFPSEDVVIYDYDAATAILLAECVHQLASNGANVNNRSDKVTTVAIVTMVKNYGHHLINHLSGVDCLIDEVGSEFAGEVWVSGENFFAPVKKLFPEIAQRVRLFSSHWDMYSELRHGTHLPLRVGTNIFRASTGERIRASASRQWLPLHWRGRAAKSPLIAVTVRATGRVCRNLPQVIADLIADLLVDYPRLGVILDGWVMPDGHRWFHGRRGNRANITADMEMAGRVQAALPRHVVVGNTIGSGISSSLSALSSIDAYVSHVGTLQHKLAFLTGKPGVVHGPTRQLRFPDSGHFSSEIGSAPLLLAPESVRDIQGANEIAGGFSDYEITNVRDLIIKVRLALAGVGA